MTFDEIIYFAGVANGNLDFIDDVGWVCVDENGVFKEKWNPLLNLNHCYYLMASLKISVEFSTLNNSVTAYVDNQNKFTSNFSNLDKNIRYSISMVASKIGLNKSGELPNYKLLKSRKRKRKNNSQIERVKALIKSSIESGLRKSSDLLIYLKERGYSNRTIERARVEMNLKSKKVGSHWEVFIED